MSVCLVARSVSGVALRLFERHPLDPSVFAHPFLVLLENVLPRYCERGGIARPERFGQLTFQLRGDLVEHDHRSGMTDRNSLGLTHPVKTLKEHQ